MLERRRLLLLPWSAPCSQLLANVTTAAIAPGVRPIVYAEDGQRRGRACRECAHARWWRRWLGDPVVGVYETEDDALLFTLHYPLSWQRLWEVRDADSRAVAEFRRNTLRDG